MGSIPASVEGISLTEEDVGESNNERFACNFNIATVVDSMAD